MVAGFFGTADHQVGVVVDQVDDRFRYSGWPARPCWPRGESARRVGVAAGARGGRVEEDRQGERLAIAGPVLDREEDRLEVLDQGHRAGGCPRRGLGVFERLVVEDVRIRRGVRVAEIRPGSRNGTGLPLGRSG